MSLGYASAGQDPPRQCAMLNTSEPIGLPPRSQESARFETAVDSYHAALENLISNVPLKDLPDARPPFSRLNTTSESEVEHELHFLKTQVSALTHTTQVLQSNVKQVESSVDEFRSQLKAFVVAEIQRAHASIREISLDVTAKSDEEASQASGIWKYLVGSKAHFYEIVRKNGEFLFTQGTREVPSGNWFDKKLIRGHEWFEGHFESGIIRLKVIGEGRMLSQYKTHVVTEWGDAVIANRVCPREVKVDQRLQDCTKESLGSANANCNVREDLETRLKVVEDSLQKILLSPMSMEAAHQDTCPELAKTQTATDDDFSSHPLVYECKESTWDLCMFLNLGHMNIGDAAAGAVMCLATSFIQIVFVCVVGRNMTGDPLSNDDLRRLEDWRRYYGHDAEYYDEFSDTSLVERVCDGSMGLKVSSTQADLYGDLDSFLGYASTSSFLDSVPGADLFNGTVLVSICVLLWIITCLNEAGDIYLFTQALFSSMSKRAFDTKLTISNDRIELVRLGRARVAGVFVLSVVPRILLLASLSIGGTQFLVYSTALADLLLNAVALAFVMDVDDMVFQAFGSRSAQEMIARVEPIYVRTISRNEFAFKYGDLKTLLRMLFCIGLVIAIDYSVLSDFEQLLKDAHAAMCGGKQNFIFAQNSASNLVYYYETSDSDTSLPDQNTAAQSFLKEALIRLIDVYDEYTDHEKRDYISWEKEYSVFSGVLYAVSPQDGADLLECEDHLDSRKLSDTYMMSAMRNAIQQQTGILPDDCEDVKSACNDVSDKYAKIAVRSLCPITCGCKYGQASVFDLEGCPSKCYDGRYRNMLEATIGNRSHPHSADCQDYNLIGNTSFSSFMGDFDLWLHQEELQHTALTGLETLGYNTSVGLSGLALTMGCTLVHVYRQNLLPFNLCGYDKSFTYKSSAAGWCPTACEIDISPCEFSHTARRLFQLNGQQP